MTELGSRSVEMEEEDDDCCYAISEGSFVGVGELLCEAARSESERAARHEHRFKLIVAGESGVGKSTFINSLVRAYANVAWSGSADACSAGSATSRQLFCEKPEAMCAVFTVDNGLDRIACSIQDTPGYGDGLDIRAQIEDVVEHIRQLDHAHFLQERDANNSSGNGNNGQRQVIDNRVDACLYFVPPHRLKEIDLAYMRRLSDVVSIIPVIGKADTMTEAELVDYKQHVLTKCMERSIRLASFEDETLQRVKWYADGPVLPFAIVASNECDNAISGDSNAFWPVRRYSWGVCQAFHREHSDCYWLRRLVIEEGFFDLKRDSNLRYTIFRNAQLQLQKPMHVKLWQRLLQLFRAPCSKQILLQEEQEMQDMMMRREFLSQVTGPSIHDTPALLHVHDSCSSPAAQHQAPTPPAVTMTMTMTMTTTMPNV